MTTATVDSLLDRVVTGLNAMRTPPLAIEALALAIPHLPPTACTTLLDQIDRLRHRPSIAEAIVQIYSGLPENKQPEALRRVLDIGRPGAEPNSWHGPTIARVWPYLDAQTQADMLLDALTNVPRHSILMPLLMAGYQELTPDMRHLAYLHSTQLPRKEAVLLLSLIAPELDGLIQTTAIERIERAFNQIELWTADECRVAVPALCAVGLANDVQQLADSTTGGAKVWLYLALLNQGLPQHQTILNSAKQLITETKSIGPERIVALAELLSLVDDAEQSALLRAGLELCRAGHDDQRRAHDLLILLPLLPPDMLPEVLAIADTIKARHWRVCVMASAAAQLDRHQQLSVPVVQTAWRTINHMRNPDYRGLALGAMLQHKDQLVSRGTMQRSDAKYRSSPERKAA